MILKKGTPILFLRLSNYKGNNFVIEHKKIIKENKFTWMLKLGRKIDKSYLKKVIECNSGIIIKESGKTNYNFYFCKLESVNYDDSLVFPEYYYDYLNNQFFDIDYAQKEGNWFKITSISKIEEKDIDKIVISSKKTALKNLAINSRAAYAFCEADNDIEI